MKHKRKIIYIIIVLSLVFITLLTTLIIRNNTKQTKTILLGNDISIHENIDKTFTSSFMDSEYLLTLLESDASKTIEGKIVKLSNLIKESSLIIINIGYVDINYVLNTNNVDEQIINRRCEVIINNVNKIIQLILNTNEKVSIKLLEIDFKNEVINEYIEILNYNYGLLNERYSWAVFIFNKLLYWIIYKKWYNIIHRREIIWITIIMTVQLLNQV